MKQNSETDNRIRSKLRSESGASISFALLLFLVCTALSAVILVAATTAAGRMAGIAETDQRYYAVTSAVEMIAELTDGVTVTAFKTKDSEEAYSYIVKPAHEITGTDLEKTANYPTVDEAAEEDVADIKSTPVYGSLYTTGSKSFFEGLAKVVLTPDTSTKWKIRYSKNDTLADDPLAVTITGSLKNNKNLKLDVVNTEGGPYNNASLRPYTLQLEFTTEINSDTVTITSTNENGESEETELETKEITFNLYTIQSPFDDADNS